VKAADDLRARRSNGLQPFAAGGPETGERPRPAPALPVPTITAIVCTYNRYDVLLEAIHSLQAQTLPPSRFEILIIDNSTDLEARDRFWKDVEPSANMCVFYEGTPGLSRARNIGLREAAAALVAYIDDDAVAAPEWLEALVETFEAESGAAIVGGPVDPVWPDAEPPWLHKWLRGFLTIVDLGPERRPLSEREWLAGTNIAFRKAALEAVGGFNETLGRVRGTLLSNEELVVSELIHKLGSVSFYAPGARVLHRVYADRVSQSWMRKRLSWQVVSDLMAGQANSVDRQQHWAELGGYLMLLPSEQRNLRGLFLDTPDPELFNKQCKAIGALMTLLLNVGDDPEAANLTC
jgi:hypothetical protein